ncbi:MAG: homoserine O-acetyltransferase [Tepidisphaeraceae bacterium]|jgi:homoserine O-acetyltransferase
MSDAGAIDKAIFESSDSVRSAAPLPHAKLVTFRQPLKLELGAQLPEVAVVYETYGTLDAQRSNAVLICHALSGDSHVARHDAGDTPGWWDIAVGPGKAIDTDRFFVICPNMLGGCRGSTGPNSVNPRTQRRYAADFPTLTIGDTVEAHRLLLDHLGIERLHAVVGGSMGGQQAMLWATRYPQRVGSCVLVATAARLSSQALAFDIVARNAILRDPNYHGGNYYDRPPGPAVGLAIARMLGHITYLSQEAMSAKFDPSRLRPRDVPTAFEKRFSVGAYLAHQGDKFVERFDANSYVSLSLMMDLFDLGHSDAALREALAPATCRWLILSFSSDWLFPTEQSRQIIDALIATDKPVSSCEVQTPSGHDAFLLQDSLDTYGDLIRAFLAGADPATPGPEDATERPAMAPLPIFQGNRPDHSAIVNLIPPGSSVLDLGCGNGELLSRLARGGGGRRVGVELEPRAIISGVQRGLDIVHADVGKSLAAFRDGQFDVVVLSQALQCIVDTEQVLRDIVRIGRQAIVSFPNFAYRRLRDMFQREGRAPKMEGPFGYDWYDTPNRRFPSIVDVEELCHRLGIRIVRKICLNSEERCFVEDDPNNNATEAVFVLVRGERPPERGNRAVEQ